MNFRKQLLISTIVMISAVRCPAVVADEPAAGQNISDISSKIVLKSIELNRFILHYRLESDRQPRYRVLRYSAAQITEPACVMAFDIITTQQFGQNMQTPLDVSTRAIRSGLNASVVGTAYAGAASFFELGSNVLREFRNRKNGFDAKSAARYVKSTFAEIDQLLLQRDALVNATTDPTAHEMLVVEGKVLKQLRDYYFHEFLVFHTDTSGYRAFENCFFSLDTAADGTGMTSAIYGLKGLKQTQYIGTSNILFAVSGATTMVAPIVSSLVARLARRHAHSSMMRALGATDPQVDYAGLHDNLQKLNALSESASPVTLASTGPIVRRLALYGKTGSDFQVTLTKERNQLGRLSKVAIESNLLGPLIGATTLVQGILGTAAYYRHQRSATTLGELRTANNMNLAGSIVGLTGTATATVGTAGALSAYELYRHRLKMAHRLPSQLIQQRLDYLDQVEREVRSISAVEGQTN